MHKKHPYQSYTPTSRTLQTRESIIEDLETVFQLALAAGKFSVALKAKELIGKEFGLFQPASKRQKFSFTDLNEDEMKEALDTAMALEFEKRCNNQAIAAENVLIQTKIDSQKDLYAQKQLQREREIQEFEEKQRKRSGQQKKVFKPRK